MFDFAIYQNERHRPTGRLLISWVASCIAHALVLLVLIENPQWLGPGLNLWLRHAQIIWSEPHDPTWRLVTVLGKSNRMQAPSAATLKELLPDRDGGKGGSGTPAVRLGEDRAASKMQTPAPLPKPVLGTKEPKPVPEAAAGAKDPDATSDQGTGPVKATGALPSNAAAGQAPTVYLPAPEPEPKQVPKKPESAANTAPSSIPDTVATPTPRSEERPKGQPPAQTAQNEQKAIQAEGSGLFDTKGFPLGDYANTVIERIKGNWFIPSNLRNSQGRTTVVFYIGKDGRYTGARIVISSGSTSLDLAALNAVLGSNPFPPLPQGFPGDRVGAKFVFSYNERH